MKLCIHRGAREIGGTCVELESSGQRILLDLGLPLNAKDVASTPLPAVAGLAKADPSLLAIILSHGHRDHWGLVPKALTGIPIVMGKAAEQIMRAAADFVPEPFAPTASQHLESGKLLQAVILFGSNPVRVTFLSLSSRSIFNSRTPSFINFVSQSGRLASLSRATNASRFH